MVGSSTEVGFSFLSHPCLPSRAEHERVVSSEHTSFFSHSLVQHKLVSGSPNWDLMFSGKGSSEDHFCSCSLKECDENISSFPV